jgi:hypothetical protein
METWEVAFVRHVYRSSPTRFVNCGDSIREKDSLCSVIDYLNPGATRTYIEPVFETYENLVGDEFGLRAQSEASRGVGVRISVKNQAVGESYLRAFVVGIGYRQRIALIPELY